MDIETPARGTFTNCCKRRKFLFPPFYVGLTLLFCILHNAPTKRLKGFNALPCLDVLIYNYALVSHRK
ncbi:hypothetical protein NJB1728f10_34090 [Mycobacterium marinum]|nr:hypothetical protein NJB1907E90_27350 [Mycobacterium marinum]GJO66072.1 hypothetical protein NJB1728f10_34090 [Mycobacterium marinum]